MPGVSLFLMEGRKDKSVYSLVKTDSADKGVTKEHVQSAFSSQLLHMPQGARGPNENKNGHSFQNTRRTFVIHFSVSIMSSSDSSGTEKFRMYVVYVVEY